MWRCAWNLKAERLPAHLAAISTLSAILIILTVDNFARSLYHASQYVRPEAYPPQRHEYRYYRYPSRPGLERLCGLRQSKHRELRTPKR